MTALSGQATDLSGWLFGLTGFAYLDGYESSCLVGGLIAGAYAGILVGGITVVAWMALAKLGGVFALYAMVPGFVASSLAILLVSLLSRRAA